MSATVFDDRVCELGEGPLWHPGRQELFWFDILGKRLLSRREGNTRDWQFDRHVSAAGWVDHDTLLIATESDLIRFDLTTDASEQIVPLEAEDPGTRSNDGRADPFGGFWIGTMGKRAEASMGGIHRYYKGELRKIVAGITIPNAICFAPDGAHAFYSDSMTGHLWKQPLDGHGWPMGDPTVFIDHGPDGKPDGAVVDIHGNLWNAHWGHFKVAVYDQAGNQIDEKRLPARQPSCPAFGGSDLSTLYVTSAREHLGDRATDHDGPTYEIATDTTGQAEHRVFL